VDGVDYHASADLSGQANHLGVTIQADIIKQKLPVNNGGYNATKHGKTHAKVYSELSSEHPIDLTRYQLANCYMGRAGLINSGGESKGQGEISISKTTTISPATVQNGISEPGAVSLQKPRIKSQRLMAYGRSVSVAKKWLQPRIGF